MAPPPARRAAIAGIGESRYTRWGGITGASEHALALEAILAAVADAGLEPDDVDGLVSFAEDRNDASFLAADLGLPELCFANMVWMPGGGGGCAAVANAALAVESGQARVVVAYRSLCQGQFHRFGQGPGARADADRPPALREARTLLEAHFAFMLPFGVLNAPIAYALTMRRHMHLHGTTSVHMGRVAVTFWAHAARNPRALMGGRPLTLADHQASPLVADPFRLLDCCLESDGACAVVVTTAERARDLRKPAVEILASAQGTVRGYGYGPFVNLNVPDESFATGGATGVARRLWTRAGLGPGDVDVAEIYDHFSGLVLLTLEDFGFCPRGGGGPFVETGALAWPDGALPTNTHGGPRCDDRVLADRHPGEDDHPDAEPGAVADPHRGGVPRVDPPERRVDVGRHVGGDDAAVRDRDVVADVDQLAEVGVDLDAEADENVAPDLDAHQAVEEPASRYERAHVGEPEEHHPPQEELRGERRAHGRFSGAAACSSGDAPASCGARAHRRQYHRSDSVPIGTSTRASPADSTRASCSRLLGTSPRPRPSNAPACATLHSRIPTRPSGVRLDARATTARITTSDGRTWNSSMCRAAAIRPE
jgi:acetyl-CoA acetyltransferase